MHNTRVGTSPYHNLGLLENHIDDNYPAQFHAIRLLLSLRLVWFPFQNLVTFYVFLNVRSNFFSQSLFRTFDE